MEMILKHMSFSVCKGGCGVADHKWDAESSHEDKGDITVIRYRLYSKANPTDYYLTPRKGGHTQPREKRGTNPR
jgi:hypothetical protein